MTDHGGDGPSVFATFIVRVSKDEGGAINAVVEWVRTGERIRVYGLAAISEVIGRMLDRGEGR